MTGRGGRSATAGPAAVDARAVRRRFVGLTGLRWLPTGLITSVLVLFEQQRGLTLAEGASWPPSRAS